MEYNNIHTQAKVIEKHLNTISNEIKRGNENITALSVVNSTSMLLSQLIGNIEENIKYKEEQLKEESAKYKEALRLKYGELTEEDLDDFALAAIL